MHTPGNREIGMLTSERDSKRDLGFSVKKSGVKTQHREKPSIAIGVVRLEDMSSWN
jgi:hypothetical protein